MKKLFLLPQKFRMIGIILLIPATALYIANAYFQFSFGLLRFGNNAPSFGDFDYTNDIAYLFILIALCFLAFSRLKNEDEMSIQIRFQSFQLSFYASLILLVVLDFATFGLAYVFYSAILWYVFLIIFIIIFYSKVYLVTKLAKDEK